MLKLTAKQTRWFTLPQDKSGETKVEILYLKPGQVADIEAKTNQVTGKQSGDDFHTEIDFNLTKRTKTFVTKSIVAWEGFNGINDKALSCTDANKLKVLEEFAWFGPQIEEFRTEYAEEIEVDQEEVEKN